MEEGLQLLVATTGEFEAMMEDLYERGYVLINIHELVEEVVDKETGEVTLVRSVPIYSKRKNSFCFFLLMILITMTI